MRRAFECENKPSGTAIIVVLRLTFTMKHPVVRHLPNTRLRSLKPSTRLTAAPPTYAPIADDVDSVKDGPL